MASFTSDRPMHFSQRDIDELVACAHAERWRRLALIGPKMVPDLESKLIGRGWDARQVFRLREPIEGSFAAKLAALTGLTSLNLAGNKIGAEGARAEVWAEWAIASSAPAEIPPERLLPRPERPIRKDSTDNAPAIQNRAKIPPQWGDT